MQKMKRKSFIILSILLVFTICLFIKIPTVKATITTYRSDDFESFPTHWSVNTANSGVFDKSSTQSHSGTYSARCYSISGSSIAYAINTTSNIGYHHTSLWVYIDNSYSTPDGYLCLMYDSLHATYGENLGISYNATGVYFRNYDGSSWNWICLVTTNVWHHTEWCYYPTPKKLSFYMDNVWYGNFTSFQQSSTLNSMYLGDTSSTSGAGNQFVYYDLLIQDDLPEGLIGGTLACTSISIFGNHNTNENWIFSSYWIGIDCEVSGYFLSDNSSGSFVNATWTSAPAINNTFCNTTKTISNTIGNMISWLVYANSSLGSFGVSNVIYTVVEATMTVYISSTNAIVEANNTIVTNGSMIKCNTTSAYVRLSSICSVNYTFLNWTSTYVNSTDNPFVLSISNQTTVWCYVSIIPSGSTDESMIYIGGGLVVGLVVGLILAYLLESRR